MAHLQPGSQDTLLVISSQEFCLKLNNTGVKQKGLVVMLRALCFCLLRKFPLTFLYIRMLAITFRKLGRGYTYDRVRTSATIDG